jgi:hypothetical protein
VFNEAWLVFRLRWAVSEAMLVLIVCAIAKLLQGWNNVIAGSSATPPATFWERWGDCGQSPPGRWADKRRKNRPIRQFAPKVFPGEPENMLNGPFATRSDDPPFNRKPVRAL